ncbi:elongation factor 1-beta-like isoform X2 [Ostrea edulis]|uniref:elongation factor 1-beta-like isoform X2 n=1 Tax=Ostrea edulis TaxID=37623 RepID=UPI0024AFA54A|nr:elongation factor 1-beta-like isoform X2 [Ostrea edulis]
MGFGDLKKKEGLTALNEYLADKSYIEGFQPSQADGVVFNALSGSPSADLVNALRWYNHIKSYGAARSSFPGQKKDLSSYGSAGSGTPAACDDDDDDDIDLFGSDDEDAKAEREKRLQQYQEKKSKKPALIAKSSLILDVKPWDDETDMAELEKSVRSIVADGLLWGASKLVPFLTCS